MRHQSDTPDVGAAVIAARQHGVASLRQLLAAGMTKSGVTRRVRAGRLHRVHRGVYAIGHRGLTHAGRCMAAALAYGRHAVVSHRSAAELWGLLPERSSPIVVSVPGISGRQKRRGVHIHRSRTLAPEMATNRGAIPVTTCERTFADLRRAAETSGCPAAVAPHELRRAIRQAEYLGLPLGSQPGPDQTRSELEAMFLRLCRRHGLPAPEVNVEVGPLTVDFLWRDRSLVVETDGYRAHRGPQAFEDDRDRDLRLRSLGYEVVRLSYKQVSEEPARIAATLRALLCGD